MPGLLILLLDAGTPCRIFPGYFLQCAAHTRVGQHNCSTWNNCAGGYTCSPGFAKNYASVRYTACFSTRGAHAQAGAILCNVAGIFVHRGD